MYALIYYHNTDDIFTTFIKAFYVKVLNANKEVFKRRQYRRSINMINTYSKSETTLIKKVPFTNWIVNHSMDK